VALSTYSQDLKGTLIGSTTDSLNGILPFANVAIFKKDQLIRAVESDINGNYEIKDIVSDTYKVVSSFPGYKDKCYEKVVIPSQRKVRLNFEMTRCLDCDSIYTTTCIKPIYPYIDISILRRVSLKELVKYEVVNAMDLEKVIDEKYMSYVYELADSAIQQDLDPFAAILVKDDVIVAESLDLCILNSDPTAHAELSVISAYCREHKLISLEGYTLYCNVEPCVMCSGAIHWAKLSRVVYGVSQKTLQSVSGGKEKPSCDDIINMGGAEIEIIGPILEEKGLHILQSKPFLSKKQRHHNYYKKGKE